MSAFNVVVELFTHDSPWLDTSNLNLNVYNKLWSTCVSDMQLSWGGGRVVAIFL